MEISIIDC